MHSNSKYITSLLDYKFVLHHTDTGPTTTPSNCTVQHSNKQSNPVQHRSKDRHISLPRCLGHGFALACTCVSYLCLSFLLTASRTDETEKTASHLVPPRWSPSITVQVTRLGNVPFHLFPTPEASPLSHLSPSSHTSSHSPSHTHTHPLLPIINHDNDTSK